MLIDGTLNCYLADINQQAEQMFHRLIKQSAKLENVTEQLKADNPMEWVTRMNNIRSRVMEVVDFCIVLRYTNYIEVQCIALKLTGGV